MIRHRILVSIVCGLSLYVAGAAVSSAAGRVFYDGFEDGTADAWTADIFNPTKCSIVTTSVDGVQGTYAGTYMAQCNYQTNGDWPTMLLTTSDYTNELFLRMRLRLDENVNRTGTLNGSDGPAAFKLLRYYHNGSPYHDLFPIAGHNQTGFNTCWNANDSDAGCEYGQGGGAGETSQDSSTWHEMEYYINQSAGTIKVWHDGTLVVNTTGHDFGGRKWTSFSVQSNGESSATDNTNNWYLDDFEVYSDNGTGGTGSMSDGTITQDGGDGTTSLGESISQGTRSFQPMINLFR